MKLQRAVLRILKDNEIAVRAIAKRLMLHKTLRRRQLEPLLQAVGVKSFNDLSELTELTK